MWCSPKTPEKVQMSSFFLIQADPLVRREFLAAAFVYCVAKMRIRI